MNVLITLDYELFFGDSGSPEKCIIEPTNRLIEIADKYNFKCVFFVDAGYLIKLKEYANNYQQLKNDYELVSGQVKELSEAGHEIQLHIHSHWEDTVYDGSKWDFDLSRYRLDSFKEEEVLDIFYRYKSILEDITDKKVFAYRAGGWCIQPFSRLKQAFIKNEITIDSTVFYKGKNTTKTQWFDFTEAKDFDSWSFEEDPCIADTSGNFFEFPIASYKVSPVFFWRLIFARKFGGDKHMVIGDGFASQGSIKQILRLLFKGSNSVVSIDGYKIKFLNNAFNKYKKQQKKNFIIIGHPKAFTKYSLEVLEGFCNQVSKNKEDIITTFNSIKV
ncbi:polysaccharide deacetylase family protein [Aquimarina latercula]|uniref:polysaccharide deacetylase family protein n=1 Tax=Aquimarina latercula TaxID=987 RepID=UPI00048244D1|nr:polysaccharide deacetylase family protein [Aquimarina latercula]